MDGLRIYYVVRSYGLRTTTKKTFMFSLIHRI